MNKKRNISKPRSGNGTKYKGKKIKALILAGIVLLGSAAIKTSDYIKANSAQNTLAKYELSLDNSVPGKSELDDIIFEFNSENPNIETDFNTYLEAQKSLFNKKTLSESKEKVNTYKEPVEKLNSDINSVISEFKDISDITPKMDNPMAIIQQYNTILEQVENYDTKMPIGNDALQIELTNALKNLKDKNDILQDIKTRYVQEFNNANPNANLSTGNITIMVKPQDYIIETKSHKYITHGDYPDNVTNYLGNNLSKTIYDVDVYSVYNNEELLESVATVNNKLSSIYDGNNPKSLQTNKNDSSLKEIMDILDSGLTWSKNPDDKFAKDKYIYSLVKLYSNKSKEMESNERE